MATLTTKSPLTLLSIQMVPRISVGVEVCFNFRFVSHAWTASLTYTLPCKVEGDHKVYIVANSLFDWACQWEGKGRVVAASLTIKAVINLSVADIGGPLRDSNLTAYAVVTVENFTTHIRYPLGGIIVAAGVVAGVLAGPVAGLGIALGVVI